MLTCPRTQCITPFFTPNQRDIIISFSLSTVMYRTTELSITGLSQSVVNLIQLCMSLQRLPEWVISFLTKPCAFLLKLHSQTLLQRPIFLSDYMCSCFTPLLDHPNKQSIYIDLCAQDMFEKHLGGKSTRTWWLIAYGRWQNQKETWMTLKFLDLANAKQISEWRVQPFTKMQVKKGKKLLWRKRWNKDYRFENTKRGKWLRRLYTYNGHSNMTGHKSRRDWWPQV